MNKLFSKLKAGVEECQEFLDEKGVGAINRGQWSRLRRFAHFWLLVVKSFVRNRCPVRAAALVYTTLLAMIPLFAVVISISTGILKTQGEAGVSRLLDRLVASLIPPAIVETNSSTGTIIRADRHRGWTPDTNALTANPVTNFPDGTNGIAPGSSAGADNTNAVPAAATGGSREIDVRTQVTRKVHEFVENTDSGTLGVTGTLLLIMAVIFMLANIENTLNDIWGIQQGRNWFVRIEKYLMAIVVGAVLLAIVGGLMNGSHMDATRRLIKSMPLVGSLLFRLLPFMILCLSFALFYRLMPNTQVQWSAALAGGFVGGLLWHVNNLLSVLYVSRVVTNSRMYGGLAMVPVIMIGLYFSWVFILFGAQVAYAFQNRAAYLAERQAENVNQRGREYVAFRLMACIGQRFTRGERPATVPELAVQLAVSTRLVQQVLQVLIPAHLILEVAGKELAYAPARPLEQMTCHDVLLAMRAGKGEDLVTCDGAVRDEVYVEFRRILDAEQTAAASVTVLAMVNRTEVLVAAPAVKAVTGGNTMTNV